MWLPQDLDVVVRELPIRTDEHQAVDLGLSDQHPIEWIPMMWRQLGQLKGMAVLDGQRLDPGRNDGFFEKRADRSLDLEPAGG